MNRIRLQLSKETPFTYHLIDQRGHRHGHLRIVQGPVDSFQLHLADGRIFSGDSAFVLIQSIFNDVYYGVM